MGKGKKIDVSGHSRNDPFIENPFNNIDPTGFSKKRVNTYSLPEKLDAKSSPTFSSTAYIRREKAGRGGKTVTTIHFKPPILKSNMESLLYEIKKKWACGGVLRKDFIEIQGDIRQSLADFFSKSGIRIKFSGG